MQDLTGRTLLGNYYLENRQGAGKIAEVYKAWDKCKSVNVAIKVLRAPSGESRDFYQYFSQEAKLMSTLEHPNIVRFYEFCDNKDFVFIVMDWVEGANLKEIIQQKKAPLELSMVLRVLKPVCSALNYAHSKKIIHCDIKPANILINQNQRVLLTDFGISKHVSQRTTGGTPPYMAPEQFDGEKLTPQTDVYGLGVTLYEMLSGGQVPYRGENSRTRSTTLRDRIHWEVMNLPYPELEKYNNQVPRGVESAVRKALSKNPMRRFQTAIEFYNVVEQGSGGAPAANGNGFGAYLQKESNPPQPVSSPPAVPAHQATTSPQVGGARYFNSLPRSYAGPFLFALQGEYEGLFIPLEQPIFQLGRSGQGQLVLQERSVSRQHAVIQITQRGVFIQDMGSKLGTYVNGQLVQGAFRLETGDVIQIGYEQVFEMHVR